MILVVVRHTVSVQILAKNYRIMLLFLRDLLIIYQVLYFLIKNGKLLCELRKNKGMTQKQLASKLGVVPKTVSKRETGKGFPDVSTLTALSDILGVSERVLLSGQIVKNKEDAGNMKRIKFYVCPYCGHIVNSSGECRIICCGKALEALKPEPADAMHFLKISEKWAFDL